MVSEWPFSTHTQQYLLLVVLFFVNIDYDLFLHKNEQWPETVITIECILEKMVSEMIVLNCKDLVSFNMWHIVRKEMRQANSQGSGMDSDVMQKKLGYLPDSI